MSVSMVYIENYDRAIVAMGRPGGNLREEKTEFNMSRKSELLGWLKDLAERAWYEGKYSLAYTAEKASRKVLWEF